MKDGKKAQNAYVTKHFDFILKQFIHDRPLLICF